MTTTQTTRPVERLAVHHQIHRPPHWLQRVAALLVVAIGVTLVAVTLAANLFKVGPAFENLTTDFRPVMTPQAIQTDRADLAGLAAVNTEFRTKLGPALAQQLGMTSTQFNAFLGQQFPAVAAGVAALPQVIPTFNGLVTTLDEQRPVFTSADAIPTSNLPATTVPWGLLVVGLLTVGVGGLLWFTPRVGAFIAVGLGAAVLVGSVAMSLPSKAGDADQLNANLKPVYTQQLVTQANGALVTLSAMGTEMQTKMLPALAQQLKMDPAQLQTYLGQNFPATTAALKDMPATMGRFNHLVSVFQNNLRNYKTMKPVSLVPIIWLLIGSMAAVVALGGLTLLRTDRRATS